MDNSEDLCSKRSFNHSSEKAKIIECITSTIVFVVLGCVAIKYKTSLDTNINGRQLIINNCGNSSAVI